MDYNNENNVYTTCDGSEGVRYITAAEQAVIDAKDAERKLLMELKEFFRNYFMSVHFVSEKNIDDFLNSRYPQQDLSL